MLKVLAVFIVPVLGACSSQPYVVTTARQHFDIGQQTVSVVSHGWHTGFVIPARDIKVLLPDLDRRFTHARYIEFGWGDKGFYQAMEITSGLTIRAIFWPTESVVHAVGLEDSAENHFPDSKVEQLCFDSREYSLLLTFIADSFHKGTQGNIVPLRKGIYGDSQFYEGNGNYYLMNTCNKWTAKGLKSAGVDITTLFKLTAGSVMDAIVDDPRNLNTAQVQKCF